MADINALIRSGFSRREAKLLTPADLGALSVDTSAVHDYVYDVVGVPNTDPSSWWGGPSYLKVITWTPAASGTITLKAAVDVDAPDSSYYDTDLYMWAGDTPDVSYPSAVGAGVGNIYLTDVYRYNNGTRTADVAVTAGSTYTFTLITWTPDTYTPTLVGHRLDVTALYAEMERIDGNAAYKPAGPPLTIPALVTRTDDTKLGLTEYIPPPSNNNGRFNQVDPECFTSGDSLTAIGNWSAAFGSNTYADRDAEFARGAQYGQVSDIVLNRFGNGQFGVLETTPYNFLTGNFTDHVPLHEGWVHFQGHVVCGNSHSDEQFGGTDHGAASWRIEGMVDNRRMGGAPTTARFVGTPTVTKLFGDTNTSGFTVSVSLSGNNLVVQSQGYCETRWICALRLVENNITN